MYKCNKCRKYGLSYNREYSPEKFIEGKTSSKIWIVGLNPKNNKDYKDSRKNHELHNYFNSREKIHSYFKGFKKVSEKIYKMLGKENGVCHTDLIKCFSNKFPPEDVKTKGKQEIINNCSVYFEKQLSTFFPQLIICNGAPVSRYITNIIIPVQNYETYYEGNYKDKEITVVLSGFIGRIDNFAKRRLGKEIEHLKDEIKKTDNEID